MDKKYTDLLPLQLFTTLMIISAAISIPVTYILFKFEDCSLFVTEFSVTSAIAITGMIISFIHISHKKRSLNAINGITHSWLSREILFAAGYCLLLIILLFQAFDIFYTGSFMNLIFIFSLFLMSFGLLITIGMVYNFEIQLTWNKIQNIAAPLASALVLATGLYAILSGVYNYLLFAVIIIADFILFYSRFRFFTKTMNNKEIFLFPRLIKTSFIMMILRLLFSVVVFYLLYINKIESIVFLAVGIIIIDRLVFYTATMQLLPSKLIDEERNKRLGFNGTTEQ